MNPMEMAIMNIIINAGDCKNHCYTALANAKEEKYEEADKELELAGEALAKAHDSQTDMLQKEAAGEKTEFSLILMHAEDQMMAAETIKSLVEEMIDMYKELKK